MMRMLSQNIFIQGSLILPLFFISVFSSFSCKSKPPELSEDIFAVIGDRIIDKEAFRERYRYWQQEMGGGVHDTYEFRRQVLEGLVRENILIAEAEKRGFSEDSKGRYERDRIEIQELLNIFQRNVLAAKVKVSEEELKQLFVQLNTRVKARHLYAGTEEEAEAIYASLLGGAAFEDMAKTIFEDPMLKDSGGSLDYLTVGDMEPGFERAVFDLEIGDISKPVRTQDGYSIIRVDDRITKPLLTEFEFAKHKHKLHAYLRKRKMKEAVETFSDSAGKELQIYYNDAVVSAMYNQFENRLFNFKGEFRLPNEIFPGTELVKFRGGVWDVETFHNKAKFTSAKQHKWIRSRRHFEEFISGLIVRDLILEQAKKAQLDKEVDYSENVAEKWNDYLYDRMVATLKAEMVVPEDSLVNYYKEDPERFAAAPKINLREIVLRDAGTADLVEKELKQNHSFSELARKYSVRSWSAEKGGELGYLQPKDFGKWATKVFSMQVGEIAGPVKMDSMVVFLQCTGKQPSRVRNYEEARADVEGTVKYLTWNQFQKSKVSEFSQSIRSLKVFSERLKELKIN